MTKVVTRLPAPNDVKILRGELKTVQVTVCEFELDLEPEAEVPMMLQAS